MSQSDAWREYEEQNSEKGHGNGHGHGHGHHNDPETYPVPEAATYGLIFTGIVLLILIYPRLRKRRKVARDC